jgi:hypothetical protein
MPCRYDDPLPVARIGYDNTYKVKIDELTQFLCYITGELLGIGAPIVDITRLDPRFAKWWSTHEAADRKRVKAEVIAFLKSSKMKVSDEDIITQLITKAEKVHPVSDWHKETWFPSVVSEARSELTAAIKTYKTVVSKRARALAKLTPEERQLLGLTPKCGKKE